MATKRKPLSKSIRFRIFARDNFTCRYCGRQSDTIALAVDHIFPVCQGGTNEEENLITACVDCNGGKAGKTIPQIIPTEADRLRLAQERNEQVSAAQAAQEARRARENLMQEVVNFWCACTNRSDVDSKTITTVLTYVDRFGVETVFPWIEKAAARCRRDQDMGRYISGCKNWHLKEQNRHHA